MQAPNNMVAGGAGSFAISYFHTKPC